MTDPAAGEIDAAEHVRTALENFRIEVGWAEGDLAEFRSRLSDMIERLEQTATGPGRYLQTERELRERATQLAEALVAGQRFRDEAARHLDTYARAFETMRSRLLEAEARASAAREASANAEELLAARTEQLAWALTRLERVKAAAVSALAVRADAAGDSLPDAGLEAGAEPQALAAEPARRRPLVVRVVRRAAREARRLLRGFTRIGRAARPRKRVA